MSEPIITVLDHGILLKPQTIRDGKVVEAIDQTESETENPVLNNNDVGVHNRRVANMDSPDWASLENLFEGKMGKTYTQALKRTN